MNSSRRAFLGRVGQWTGGAMAAGLLSQTAIRRVKALVAEKTDVPPGVLARDEAFWRQIQQAYTIDRSLIHLNAGGVSPAPRQVQEALKSFLDSANHAPSHYMWRVRQPNKEHVRRRLARLAGTSSEEIAICRNATEALENVIFGIDFEPGDEVLTTTQDYPNMMVSWQQREKRDKIFLRKVEVPTPPPSLEALVKIFEEAITPRTRLIMVSHMVNLTGQIFPVREICRMAHARGIQVLCDGAHTFAHLDFKIPDLECDYFGTSLHKWLSAPFGTGMLYARKDRIAGVWPLFGHEEPEGDDIRKFERIGTHPVPNFLAIGEAVSFHQLIGARRKEERLRYLKDYWAQQALEIPGLSLNTVLDPAFSCGLANFALRGKKPKDISAEFLKEHRIVVTPIVHEECRGTRVTPHVYTSIEELDMFVDALKQVARA